ncbi:hypothetical protein ACIRJR_24915 [Streptomyces sp. NPDC102402]|uniref:hypothetical protein n=1 Tax=Streptomyces sp. NPDC102402 TaxID=3366169 RepID=UPI003819A7FC
MKFQKRVALTSAGIALAAWGFSAPAQAATPGAANSVQVAASSVQIQGTIKCAPESKNYTVGSKIAPVRSGPHDQASQIDVVYPGNSVHGYYHCINGESKIFVCIGVCKVSETGISGRWVFRGHLS